jgi:hypothetical protein
MLGSFLGSVIASIDVVLDVAVYAVMRSGGGVVMVSVETRSWEIH